MEIEPSTFEEILHTHYFSLETPSTSLIPLLFSSISPIKLPDFLSLLTEIRPKYPKMICAALINHGDLGFKCYDCGNENEYHIYCENCFKNSEHAGHRVMYSCERSGCCDCGDASAILPVGFCKNHQGYQQNAKFVQENAVETAVVPFFQRTFATLLEEYEKNAALPTGSEEKIAHFQKIQRFNALFFEFLQELCVENLCVAQLLGELLRKPLNFQGESAEFLHDCHDSQRISLLSKKKPCECSALELVFRFNEFIDEETQEKMEKLWFSLFVNYEFKRFLVQIFAKTLDFLVKPGNSLEKPHFSKFWHMYAQFFADELMDLLISGDFFERCVGKVAQLLDFFKEKDCHFPWIFAFFNHFFNLFLFIAHRKKSFKEKTLKSALFEDFLRVVCRFREFCFENWEKHKELLLMLRTALKLVEEFALVLYEALDFAQFAAKIKQLLAIFQENPQDFLPSAGLFEEKAQVQSLTFLHQPATFAISLLLAYFLLKSPDFASFLAIFPLSQEFQRRLLGNCAKTLVAVQTFSEFFPETADFAKKKLILEVFFVDAQLNFKDFLVSLSQILLFSLPESPNLLRKLAIFPREAHFLTFFARILVDEVAIVNTCAALPLKSSDFRWKILRNLLVNALFALKTADFRRFRDILKRNLLSKHVEIQENLLEIADLQEKTKEFKLKVPWQDVYQPFFWCSVQELGGKYLENLQETAKKSKEIDLFLGSRAKTSRNSFFKHAISGCQNAEFLHFLAISLKNALISSGNPAETVENFRLSLQLLYVLLDVDETDAVFPEIAGFLEKEAEILWKTLEEAEKSAVFVEFQRSFAKFREVLRTFSQNPQLSKQKSLTQSASFEAQAKRELQKKALLQQFSAQQRAFLAKNQEILEETGEKLASEAETVGKCSICREENGDFYVSPAYFSLDTLHNYYYKDWPAFPLEISKKSRVFSRERAVILSCNHQTHRTCLANYLKKKRESRESLNFRCFCCQFQCNLSIPMINSCLKPRAPAKSLTFPCESAELLNENLCKSLISQFSWTSVEKSLQFPRDFEAEVETFADNVAILVVSLQKPLENEFFVVESLFEALLFCSEAALSDGLDAFFKEKAAISRNLLVISKLLFWSSRETTFFPLFFKEFTRDLGEKFAVLLDFDAENPAFLRNLDVFFAEIAWKLAVLAVHEEEHAQKLALWTGKLLVNKLILTYGYVYALQTHEVAPSLQQFLEKMEDFDFRIKTLSFVLPFFHVIAAVFAIIFNFDAEKLRQKLENCCEINEQLGFLASFLGNTITLDLEIMNSQGEKWLHGLNSLNSQGKASLFAEIARNPCLKYVPAISQETFLEFLTNFVRNRCEICQDFPRRKKTDLYVCFICGKTLCNSYCGAERKNNEFIGNLAAHAMENHANKCFFVNILDSKIIYLDVPLIFFGNFLYWDKLGQSMTRTSMNFKDFFLNQLQVQKMRRVVARREISQDLHYQILKNPNNLVISDKI